MTKIQYSDLENAYQFLSFGGNYENSVAINKKSGVIFYVSDMVDVELPEDFDEMDDDLLWLPEKNDFDLGTSLVFGFVNE